MWISVNATSRAANNRYTCGGKPFSNFHSYTLTVKRIISCTNHCNTFSERLKLSIVIEDRRRQLNFFQYWRVIFIDDTAQFNASFNTIINQLFRRIRIFPTKIYKRRQCFIWQTSLFKFSVFSIPNFFSIAKKINQLFQACTAYLLSSAYRRYIIFFHIKCDYVWNLKSLFEHCLKIYVWKNFL